MADVTVTHEGRTFSAYVEDGEARVFEHKHGAKLWAGTGVWDWSSGRIIDCPAAIPEEVFAALETALVAEIGEEG